VEVKGTALHSLLGAIERVFGSGGLELLRAALPSEVRAQLEPVVLASANYPVAVSAAIHAAVRDELGGGSVNANRRVGAEAARVDFRGVYSVFIRLADYDTLLGGLGRAWRRYNSRGVVEWVAKGPASAIGEVRDVDGYTEPMWHAVAGRLEAILLLGGAKHASVEVQQFSAGSVRLRCRWTP
jgi:uncharacterized protein (TIGR02265 family)